MRRFIDHFHEDEPRYQAWRSEITRACQEHFRVTLDLYRSRLALGHEDEKQFLEVELQEQEDTMATILTKIAEPSVHLDAFGMVLIAGGTRG